MRTGGGVGLPGRRPLPPIHTLQQLLAPPHALRRRRALPLPRSLARASAHSPPRDRQPSQTRAPRPHTVAPPEPPCSAEADAPQLSAELVATYRRAGRRRRPHPRFLPERREEPLRTDATRPRGPDSGVGARGGAGRRLEVEGLGWV